MRDLEGLLDIAPEIKRRGGAIVAVSMDPWSRIAERQDRMRRGVNMLADPEGVLVRSYGLEDVCFGDDIARPAAFVIDGAGVIRWRNIPTSWRYRPGAPVYLEALETLLSPEASHE